MKGYAIIIGVDKVDETHYGTGKNPCCSLNDANKIHELIVSTGIYEDCNIILRTGKNTKWENLKPQIEALRNNANKEKNGAYIFLYFSGHGAFLESRNKEFLCFYDRLVLEDEIREQIAGFNENCKIFAMLDACYGGGLVEFAPKAKFLESTEDICKKYSCIYDPIFKLYPLPDLNVLSEVFYLFACGKKQLTDTGAKCTNLSIFTSKFVSYWESIDHSRYNYNSFYHLFTEVPKNTVFPVHRNRKSNFFFNSYPLTFNLNVMLATIDLYETDNTPVGFRLLPNVPPLKVEYSLTLQPDDPLYAGIIAMVDNEYHEASLTANVEFMSLVILSDGGNNTYTELNSFYSIDNQSISNGLVVSLNRSMRLWHKPKRTDGKVSNKLG